MCYTDFVVNPRSIQLGINDNSSAFTIENNGHSTLNWALEVRSAFPGLIINPDSGFTEPGMESDVQLSLDRGMLNYGTPNYWILINTESLRDSISVYVENRCNGGIFGLSIATDTECKSAFGPPIFYSDKQVCRNTSSSQFPKDPIKSVFLICLPENAKIIARDSIENGSVSSIEINAQFSGECVNNFEQNESSERLSIEYSQRDGNGINDQIAEICLEPAN